MLLINSKVKLKLKWTNQCVLAAAGNDNIGANPDNIIFTTFKDAKLCVPVVTLLEKDDQKPLVETFYQSFGRSVYWNKYKRQSENKNTRSEYIYFLQFNQTL